MVYFIVDLIYHSNIHRIIFPTNRQRILETGKAVKNIKGNVVIAGEIQIRFQPLTIHFF